MPRCSRRTFSRWSLAASTFLPMGSAWSQGWPHRPIRIVVGFPAGQAADNIVRIVAQRMSDALKQPVVVENRPGAAAIIAAETVKAAAPDGHTLLVGSNGSLAVNPTLFRKLSYDPLRDFEPVAVLAGAPFMVFTSPALPVHNLNDLLEYAKERSDKVSYGSPGPGTGGHMTMEMIKSATRAQIAHSPYKGSPAMITDVVGGRIEFGVDSAASIVPFARGGRVRLVAVSSAKRSPFAPDVPTVAEQGVPGFDLQGWTGLVAPKGTPPGVIATLNLAVTKALRDPAVIASLESTCATPIGGSPSEFAQFLRLERTRWAEAVRLSGAQAE
jgi:tripartite-type tricarboxylate transporter receptor subunit TctC